MIDEGFFWRLNLRSDFLRLIRWMRITRIHIDNEVVGN